MISRYNGTIYCLVAIASRLEWFESATDIRDVTALALSAIYDFSFIFGCVNLSLVCLFRTACLVNVSRVEETFGERTLQATLVASSAALAMRPSCFMRSPFASGDHAMGRMRCR